MIDIPRIRAFLVAAECLNFTEAAKRLYVTQPTLSKQIALIEDDLGFKLFVRSNRNVSLTPEGVFLYKRMRGAIDSLDSAVLLARAVGKGQEGVLRIGCFEALDGNPMLLKLFSRFRQLCPNADLQVDFLSFRQLRERLINNELDAIITKLFEVDTILGEAHATLFQSEPVVVMGKDHPLANRERLDISELSDHPFIAISPAESLGAYNQLYSYCHVASFPPNIERYVENYSALFLYLCLSPCAAIVDRYDVGVARDNVRAIPLDGFAPQATVVAWKRDNMNFCMGPFRQALEQIQSEE